ncbi:MAG: DUF4097 family beta strand repeat protein [Clostridia bacterium]|nr:DUF4097 family beta strand repeat protein [Clostridia bacterium]
MNRNEFFPALPVTKLKLRLTSAALEIITDDIEDIHVMASGGKADIEELRIAAAADTLTIEQPVSKLTLVAPATGSWLQLTLRLPRSWKGAVEARSVSGWMTIRGLSGTDMSLDTVSGMVSVSDVSFLTLSARAVTGDVKLLQSGVNKASLFSTSGELTATSVAVNTLSASTVTGEISLDLLAPFEELSLHTVTGDLHVAAPITACDATIRSVSGHIHPEGVEIVEGAAKLRAVTVSSDLDISCNLV